MPPKVATPAQAEAAKTAAAGMQDLRTGAPGSGNRFQRTRPLTKFERDALRQPVGVIYVYNVSPIFKWHKDFPGLGPMNLQPRREDQRVSDPIEIIDRLVRGFDGGNGIRRLMVENPRDIVEDFLCCSPEFPGRQENNLTRYGCFFLEDTPLDELPQDEQEKILDAAELEHRNRLHEKVGDADALQNTQFRVCIGEIHRKAALYLHKVGDIAELPDWVQRRSKLNTTDECRFCGYDNKRGIPKCRNCHEVLDQEAYDRLKGEGGKKKKSKD
jgi:hypothetical protein